MTREEFIEQFSKEEIAGALFLAIEYYSGGESAFLTSLSWCEDSPFFETLDAFENSFAFGDE